MTWHVPHQLIKFHMISNPPKSLKKFTKKLINETNFESFLLHKYNHFLLGLHSLSGNTMLVTNRLTRFGKISPFWHKFIKVFGNFSKVLFSIWQYLGPTLAKYCYWANFHCCKWSNIWSTHLVTLLKNHCNFSQYFCLWQFPNDKDFTTRGTVYFC